jgi:hypothetical protein
MEEILNVFLPMTVSTEAIKQDLERLNRNQLKQVADFIAFLKFRDRSRQRVVLDPIQLADVFAEFADEDRAFAEAGMNDYAVILSQEDKL